MPDHLYLPAAGQPISWRDHLRAHPLSVTLLALVTISALGIIADSLLLHTTPDRKSTRLNSSHT